MLEALAAILPYYWVSIYYRVTSLQLQPPVVTLTDSTQVISEIAHRAKSEEGSPVLGWLEDYVTPQYVKNLQDLLSLIGTPHCPPPFLLEGGGKVFSRQVFYCSDVHSHTLSHHQVEALQTQVF
jgi:hypothetical protein